MTDSLQRERAPADRLEQARERVADVNQRIADHGDDIVTTAAEAYREAMELLEDYSDRATGTGQENFKAYLELEGAFATLVEGLPEELPPREAFEDALDAIDKRRLSERDFERAREALEPAERFVELIDERERAIADREEARTAAKRRLREIDTEREDCERLLELDDADLDAPVDRLREPIETYNDAIREAFERYRLEASAQEVFTLLDRSRWYPLVAFEPPPAELRTYVMERSAGEYTIPELLEYADYSRSKLEHYVANADELKRRVATRQTYLKGIGPEPLTIGWPPPSAGAVRYHVRERRPFVARVADEDVVAALRAVGQLATDPDIDYDRLQRAAVATDQLTADERRRLSEGRVADELEALETERARIEAALAGDHD